MKQDLTTAWQDLIRLKLAEKLGANPSSVEHVSIKDPDSPFDLRLGQNTYSIRFCNPVYLSKTKKDLFWDFDLRKNFWRNGKTQKSFKVIDPCTFYLLVGMVNDIPKRIFLVPAKTTPSTHVRIVVDGKSKYNNYEI